MPAVSRSARPQAEDKLAFKNVVHDAPGEDEEQADAAFFQMQKTISAMVAEREEDDRRRVELTPRRSLVWRPRPRCRMRCAQIEKSKKVR